MKLLFDENLSFRLTHELEATFPDSAHVRDLGLEGAADEVIWNAAAEGDYLLTSKDSDFYQRSVVHGVPPKVIWLRVGNMSTAKIAALLRSRYLVIRHFAEDSRTTFLPLGAT